MFVVVYNVSSLYFKLAFGLTYVDPSVRRKRKKGGGNKKKMFTEGWIEFMDRRTAKMVATCLNNQLLGTYVFCLY